MKKKYLIVGLFSIIFGIGYSFGLEDGFYHNSNLGLISFVSGGNVLFTAQDKDLGATCTDVNADCSRGNLYQWGNDYGFSSFVAPTNISNNSINYTNYFGSSFNSNGVFYSKYYYTGIDNSNFDIIWGPDPFPEPYQLGGPCSSGFTVGLQFEDRLSISISGLSYYLFFRHYDYHLNSSGLLVFPFFNGFSYWSNFASLNYSDSSWIMYSDGSTLYSSFHEFSNSDGLPVRCFSLTPVVPDSSWVYLNSPCSNLNGKTGTISIIETDTGTYYTLTLGDGTACTLPNDFGLSGGAIQIQNNNTWSGTITIVDDSYITYTDLSGNVILITTGYDINKGTWENILTAFSGHQLTIYETDSGSYYTFVDSNGQIKTADVNGVFNYLSEQLQFTGLQTGSYNMMTANRWYGQMLDKGRHFFQCGVDYGTKNVFSARISDYYYTAKIVDKLDTNLLGFMLCPFYSLLAGISDNFDNSTMMRSGYKPILNHTGYFNHGSSVNRGKFYSFFDATLIFVIFITYGSIFYFIIRKF